MKVTIIEQDDLIEAINHLRLIPPVDQVAVGNMLLHMGTDEKNKQVIIIENADSGFYITNQND